MGAIELRAPAVGGVCVFVCLSRCRSAASVRSRGTYLEKVKCHDLLVDFDAALPFFSEKIALSDGVEMVHFCRQVAEIFAKSRSKIAKSQKMGGKVCAHNFIYNQRDFNIIPPYFFRGENVDVHLYNFFSTRCYNYSAGSNCQSSHG